MITDNLITLALDAALLEHPRALHLRRMRMGLWLYLAIVAKAPTGAESFEIEPAAIATQMGLTEGTVRSWLGHLRKGGYLEAVRLNGKMRVTLKRITAPSLPEPEPARAPTRFFTAQKLQDALGERSDGEALQAALSLYGDEVVKRALARTLAVPPEQIRRSRTALFLYLLKRHAHAPQHD